MSEFIKIAENGQWSLEKADNPDKFESLRPAARRGAQDFDEPTTPAPGRPSQSVIGDEGRPVHDMTSPRRPPNLEQKQDTLSDIEAFIANKKAQREKSLRIAMGKPRSKYPEGMRPVQVSTMNHRGAEDAMPSADRVNEVRSKIAEREAANAPKVVSRENITRQEAEDDEWRIPAYAKIVASDLGRGPKVEYKPQLGGATGGRRIVNPKRNAGPQVERKPQLGAQPRIEQVGPIEVSMDPETGQRVMQPRKGTFHGEGATTHGKIVDRIVAYETKDGEKRYKRIPQLERFRWSWDDDKQKWNHLKTEYINPNDR